MASNELDELCSTLTLDINEEMNELKREISELKKKLEEEEEKKIKS